MTQVLDSPVVFAVGIVSSAHQRFHRTRIGVDGDECRFKHVMLFGPGRSGVNRIPYQRIQLRQAYPNRFFRNGLELYVHGSVYFEPSVVDQVTAVLFDHHITDIVYEERALRRTDAGALQDDFLRFRLPCLLLCYEMASDHPVEYDLAPRQGPVHMVIGVITARRLQKPGQKRRLAKRQCVGVFAEIPLCRFFYTVGVRAVVHVVNIG